MRKLGKIIVVICLILFWNNSYSQIKIGPKFGFNFAKIHLSGGGINFDPKIMLGVSIGATAEIKIQNDFYLQPAVLLSTKGSKYTVNNQDLSIIPVFIEIPVNALWKFNLGNSAKFLLYTGPYLAYGVGGNITMGSIGGTKDILWGTSTSDDMKPFDLGLNLGTGIEVANFQFTTQYNFSLTNLSPESNYNGKMKSGVFSISMAYLFGK